MNNNTTATSMEPDTTPLESQSIEINGSGILNGIPWSITRKTSKNSTGIATVSSSTTAKIYNFSMASAFSTKKGRPSKIVMPIHFLTIKIISCCLEFF